MSDAVRWNYMYHARPKLHNGSWIETNLFTSMHFMTSLHRQNVLLLFQRTNLQSLKSLESSQVWNLSTTPPNKNKAFQKIALFSPPANGIYRFHHPLSAVPRSSACRRWPISPWSKQGSASGHWAGLSTDQLSCGFPKGKTFFFHFKLYTRIRSHFCFDQFLEGDHLVICSTLLLLDKQFVLLWLILRLTTINAHKCNLSRNHQESSST